LAEPLNVSNLRGQRFIRSKLASGRPADTGTPRRVSEDNLANEGRLAA
jgi:hypothetical protein